MYIRQCFRNAEWERRAYWALVESVRTERGPRQNVVAWLGAMDVTRCGMPLGCEVFAGNTADVTSEDNLEFLRQENRRYIIGTNKALLTASSR